MPNMVPISEGVDTRVPENSEFGQIQVSCIPLGQQDAPNAMS